MTCRVVVLASGTGSLFKALIEVRDPAVEVVALITDRPRCGALEVAAANGIPTEIVDVHDFEKRSAWDAALAAKIDDYSPDLIVSAGFMRVLGPHTLIAGAGRIINTHPALLPSFPGAHAVRDALAYGAKVAGSTVNVIDIGIDTGPIIAQEAVLVMPDDDESSLHERIKVVERRLIVDIVGRIARGRLVVDGRKVTIA